MARFTLTMSLTGMPSVMADDEVQPGVHAFQNGVGGEGRRDKNGGGGRAGLLHGFGDGVEDGDFLAAVLEELAAFAGRDAGDDLGAVVDARVACAARRSCR